MSSLLLREVLTDSKPGQSKQGHEIANWSWVVRAWENWEAAFLIYAGVTAEAYPDRSPALFK